jgi:hypothetical protein
MTLPFFGSGIVELPPDGFKRAKNSQKMQMVFFVHEGKVLVTVGPKAVAQKGGAAINSEMNEFAISKGGVWVVPRGMSLNSPCPFTFGRRHPPARAQKATFRHHLGSMAPTELSRKSGQRRLPPYLLVFVGAVQERCVRPAVGITSALHTNTARAAHRRTDAQSQVSSGTVSPSGNRQAPRRVTSQLPARVCSVARQGAARCLGGRMSCYLRSRCGGACQFHTSFYRVPATSDVANFSVRR